MRDDGVQSRSRLRQGTFLQCGKVSLVKPGLRRAIYEDLGEAKGLVEGTRLEPAPFANNSVQYTEAKNASRKKLLGESRSCKFRSISFFARPAACATKRLVVRIAVAGAELVAKNRQEHMWQSPPVRLCSSKIAIASWGCRRKGLRISPLSGQRLREQMGQRREHAF